MVKAGTIDRLHRWPCGGRESMMEPRRSSGVVVRCDALPRGIPRARHIGLLLAVVLSGAAAQECASVDFSKRIITTQPVNACSIFVIDVDGDGDADVLSASWSDDTVERASGRTAGYA